MKFTFKTLLVLCFLVLATATANAMQQQVALVTIRFNQQVVLYQNQLYNAVVEAVKTKPSVVFTVVGIAPQHSDSDKAAKLFKNTEFYMQKVQEDLLKIGVNPVQVRSRIETSPNVKDEEVKIFVN